MPNAEKSAARSGIEITPPQNRGATTRASGSTAIISIAASCSVVFMSPISAVMADPARLASRKRLAKPSLLAAPVTAPPMRRSHCATPAVSSTDIGEQLLAIGRGWIVERDRPVGSAVDELPDERIARSVHFLRRTRSDDPT